MPKKRGLSESNDILGDNFYPVRDKFMKTVIFGEYKLSVLSTYLFFHFNNS